MGLEHEGFDELFNTLDALENVGSKIGKKAVKDGLDIALKQMQADAPKDSGEGARGLDIHTLKEYKSGSVWGKCGISKKNWRKCKGLWFQHFGYTNHITGKKVKNHVGWMTSSFLKVKDKANKVMMDSLKSEIDKVIK